MSKCGGCTSVSYGLGGPAGDHTCMGAADLFNKKKWKVAPGKPWSKLLYDAGVTSKTKSALLKAECDLVTSGIVRNNKNNHLSFQQRAKNFAVSSLRIRVENFIGIVKNKNRILTKVMPLVDIGMMDKIVYCAFMLHNFGFPIVL